MKAYEEDIAGWERFYCQQVDYQLSKNNHNQAACNVTVGGGVTMQRPSASIIKIGPPKDQKGQKPNQADDNIQVILTSPSEATVNQAKSEMERVIKGDDKVLARISKETAKRAASTTSEAESPEVIRKKAKTTKVAKKKTNNNNNKKKKKKNNFNDIFG